MTTPSWQANGQYFETCSCDFVCPCILGQMAVAPTKGSCTFAMAFQIERGTFGDLRLDGLGFVVLGSSLIGFALSRLAVGLLIIHRSGLWRASRRAWVGGGIVVTLATLANAIHSVIFVLGISSAI